MDDPLLFYYCGNFLDMGIFMFSMSLAFTVNEGLEETAAEVVISQMIVTCSTGVHFLYFKKL